MLNRPLDRIERAEAATKSVANIGRSLERRPRLAQESQLLRAGGASQNRIAVGVAAKAVDDGFVAQLEVQVVLYAQLRKQRHGMRGI